LRITGSHESGIGSMFYILGVGPLPARHHNLCQISLIQQPTIHDVHVLGKLSLKL